MVDVIVVSNVICFLAPVVVVVVVVVVTIRHTCSKKHTKI